MSGPPARLPVKVDEWTKLSGISTDDGHHQGEPEHAGADERCRSAPHPDPNKQSILCGTRVDTLTREGSAVVPRLVDLRIVADGQQKIELLGEEGVVVGQGQSEEGEGLGE